MIYGSGRTPSHSPNPKFDFLFFSYHTNQCAAGGETQDSGHSQPVQVIGPPFSSGHAENGDFYADSGLFSILIRNVKIEEN